MGLESTRKPLLTLFGVMVAMNMLVMAPTGSYGARGEVATDFGGGFGSERYITFPPGGGVDLCTFVEVPSSTPVHEFDLRVEGMAAGADEYPLGVTLDVGGDGDIEWAFPHWPGAGALGYQNSFHDGDRWDELSIPPGKDHMDTGVYLPQDARVSRGGLLLSGGSEYYFSFDMVDDNAGMVGDVSAGDLDGDGDVDLAALLLGGGELGWYENKDQTGTIWQYHLIDSGGEYSPSNGTGISAFTCADWNNDGMDDIIVSANNGVVGLFQRNGIPGSGALDWDFYEFASGMGAGTWVQAGDMDSDGDLDVVVALLRDGAQPEHELVLLLQAVYPPTSNTTMEMRTIETAEEIHSAAIIDADGNGYIDIAGAVTTGGAHGEPLLLLYSDPAMTPQPVELDAYRTIIWKEGLDSPEDMAALDMDGDGRTDVVSLDSPSLTWYANPGTGVPGVWANHTVSSDVDGDDLAAGHISTVIQPSPVYPDLAVASRGTDRVTWFRNPLTPKNAAGWAETAVTELEDSCRVLLVDVDGKGDLDFVVSGGSSGKLAWLDADHSAPSGVTVEMSVPGGAVALWEQPEASGFMMGQEFHVELDDGALTEVLSAPGGLSAVEDDWGNRMVLLPLVARTGTPGSLNVSSPAISYSYRPLMGARDPRVPVDELNEHLGADAITVDGGGGTVRVPICVSSMTSGVVRLSDLTIGYNAPPVQVITPGEMSVREGSSKKHLLELSHLFEDDRTPSSQMHFQLNSVDPAEGVNVYVEQARSLTIDMSHSDFNGEVVVLVEAFDDGSPDGSIKSTVAEPMLINVRPVNDEPRSAEPIPSFQMAEGGFSKYIDPAGDGHFTDVEGDELAFRCEIDPEGKVPGHTLKAELLPGAGTVELHTSRDWFTSPFRLSSPSDWYGGPVEVRVWADDLEPLGEEGAGEDLAFQVFEVTVVNSDDDPPYWSTLPEVALIEDAPMAPCLDLAEYAHDIDTPPGSLRFSAVGSTNRGVRAVAGDDGTLWLEPRADFFGTSMITLQVFDGLNSRETVLHVEVEPVNDLPEVAITSPVEGSVHQWDSGDGGDGGDGGRGDGRSITVAGTAHDAESLKRVQVRLYRPSDGLSTHWFTAEGTENWRWDVSYDSLPGPGDYIVMARARDGEQDAADQVSVRFVRDDDGPEPEAASPEEPPEAVVLVEGDDDGAGSGDAPGDTRDEDAAANPGAMSLPAAAGAVVVASALVGLGGYLGGTQQGKYSTTALFFPLYTKLKRKKILDNFTRGRIYEYIRAHPGAHFNEIKRDLDLKNGSLTYHLMTLEREEFVKSRNSGVYKRFYLYNVRIPKRQVIKLSRIQERIVAVILVHPGATQKEIVDITGIKQQTVNRNINQLLGYGAIDIKREGRKTRCFINVFGGAGDGENDEDRSGARSAAAPGVQLVLRDCPHCGKKNTPLFHGCFELPQADVKDEISPSPT